MRIDLPEPALVARILAEVTGQTLSRPPLGICTDSRECRADDLYIAIAGERTDGHNFLDQVQAAGAAAALVRTPAADLDKLQQLAVPNPVAAIGAVAARWRSHFEIPVIAITGSNGKTTTRELLAHLLAASGNIHATRGNYNTSIGLPLSLLTLAGTHTVSVLEMGANRPGDIARLAGIARPTHGLITNIAPAHLEGFGSLEAVARTKGELFAALETGTAFVNLSDPRIGALPIPGGKVTFGLLSDCDYPADLIREEDGQIMLVIDSAELHTRSHNDAFARNVIAAAVIAAHLELDWTTIQARLDTFTPPPGRCELKSLGDLTIIDDTYNANLSSALAALRFLKTFKTPGRRILVFGDMFELGAFSEDQHRQLGQEISLAGLDAVFTVGELTRFTGASLSNTTWHRHYATREELLADLKTFVRARDVILVKGSRGMAMETIITGLGES